MEVASAQASRLDVRNLTVRYGMVEAVHEVSLTVERRQVVALVGPNGAGKTSLARALAGLLPSAAGQVLLSGEDISALSAARRVGVGLFLVPEGRAVFPSLTVEENLLLGGYRRRLVRLSVTKIYDQFPVLQKLRRRKAGTLSGGEQQLLVIARALIGRPQIMILDEPSMGLAPKAVEDLVGTLREAEIEMLIMEQNARLAISLADQVYGISHGQATIIEATDITGRDAAMLETYFG